MSQGECYITSLSFNFFFCNGEINISSKMGITMSGLPNIHIIALRCSLSSRESNTNNQLYYILFNKNSIKWDTIFHKDMYRFCRSQCGRNFQASPEEFRDDIRGDKMCARIVDRWWELSFQVDGSRERCSCEKGQNVRKAQRHFLGSN